MTRGGQPTTFLFTTLSTAGRRVERSVVIPVHNEAASIAPLMGELARVLQPLGGEWEVIWIDDGSTDGTPGELAKLLAAQPPNAMDPGDGTCSVRALGLPRRLGQSAALWAGLQEARGQAIITLDGDGQNDPRDIPRMLSHLETADMVVGCRQRRRDRFSKRLFSRGANLVRNFVTGSRLPDSGCSLRAMRREVIASFIPFRGMHRFLPTLAEIAGWRVVSLAVNHRPRKHGRSHYGIADRLLAPLVDCLMLAWLKRRKMSQRDWIELEPESAACQDDARDDNAVRPAASMHRTAAEQAPTP